MTRERILSTMDVLNEIVIIIIKPVKHKSGEVLVLKRPTNRGQGVNEARHLVEVLRDAEITKLGLTQLGAYKVRMRLRLRGETSVEGRPRLPGRSGEDDHR